MTYGLRNSPFNRWCTTSAIYCLLCCLRHYYRLVLGNLIVILRFSTILYKGLFKVSWMYILSKSEIRLVIKFHIPYFVSSKKAIKIFYSTGVSFLGCLYEVIFFCFLLVFYFFCLINLLSAYSIFFYPNNLKPLNNIYLKSVTKYCGTIPFFLI